MNYGLALGSGGVKGFAHLGSIKALEELGFEPDIIAGTSAGSIVGSLYSMGMTPDEMLALKGKIMFFKILKLNRPVDGLSSIKGLERVLKPYLDGVKFSDLKKNFMAVALDIVSGKEVVLDKGEVLPAVCASCCVPGVFDPVRLDNKILIDGGFVTPVPVQPLRRVGADKIISISLSHLKPDFERINMVRLFGRTTDVMVERLMDDQETHADIAIRLPTYDAPAISIRKADELFKIGYNTVKKRSDDIKKLLKD